MEKTSLIRVLFSGILLMAVILAVEAGPLQKNARYDAIVSAEGSGTHTNLQQAIDAAPDNGSKAFSIFIKTGSYEGQFIVPTKKKHIRFIGENLTNRILT